MEQMHSRVCEIYISVTNVELWDMEQAHSGICEIGVLLCVI